MSKSKTTINVTNPLLLLLTGFGLLLLTLKLLGATFSWWWVACILIVPMLGVIMLLTGLITLFIAIMLIAWAGSNKTFK